MDTHDQSRTSTAKYPVPADGVEGLLRYWRSDLIAGLLVSLIALPLCLGIAMASGFPPFGGLITAIVGGLIVGPLCGSQLTIKGPAAGLIAIAIASVEALGGDNLADGYRLTLAVIVVSSVLQIAFATLKLGRFADFFPASVVNGMLAAIGIIIFSKQIHPLLGVKAIARDPIPLLLEIPHSLVVMNPEVAFIGVTSILIVVFATQLFGRLARFLPGPLVAVAAGILLCLHFDFNHPHNYEWYSLKYSVDGEYLVKLPQPFFGGITFPDFSQILSWTSLQYILLFALIGSLEALLTNKAVDSLDPASRKAHMNRDLFAIGTGNLVCGLLGGLPMISEVVRSSANISYGAKTRWANFFHGGFLLIFVLLLTPIIQLIPKAALAGVLCVTGYRLAAPRNFRQCRAVGGEQLFVFIITIVATLLTDLLMGVFIGMLTEYAVCTAMGVSLKDLFSSIRPATMGSNGQLLIKMPAACIFGNVIGFKKAIQQTNSSPLTLDFSETRYVDHTFMLEMRRAEKEQPITTIGLDRLAPLSEHREAARRAVTKTSRILPAAC